MGLPSFLKEKKVLIIIIVAVIAVGVAAFLFLGGEPAEEEEAAVSTRVTIQAPEVSVEPQEITPEKEGEAGIPAAPLKKEAKAAAKPIAAPAPMRKEIKKEAPKAEVKAAIAKEKRPSYKPWVINAASFNAKSSADELKNALKKGGYNAYYTEFFKDGVKWHRVRVGFYESEAEARGVANKIAGSYKLAKPWVVQPT